MGSVEYNAFLRRVLSDQKKPGVIVINTLSFPKTPSEENKEDGAVEGKKTSKEKTFVFSRN